MGHAAQHRRRERGERVEATPADHHAEKAFEKGFGQAGQGFAGVDVLVDFRVELAGDHVHAADSGADEDTAEEGHQQVLVVDRLAVALGDLGELGRGALPQLLQAFLDALPRQAQQLVLQAGAQEADQRTDDLLADFDQGGDGGRAETGRHGDRDLDDLGERRDHDVVLGGLGVQGELVGGVAERRRDLAAGGHVLGDVALELRERRGRGTVQAAAERVAQVRGGADPVEQLARESVQLLAHAAQGGRVGFREFLTDPVQDEVVSPLPLGVVGDVEVRHRPAAGGWAFRRACRSAPSAGSRALPGRRPGCP
ncbi:hypothetical protein [Paractinoplanes brasiliensis]|uniref:hypothetical protein n=1 Tax=Paractinoplanes brasiliensis TaxID=52695 RepID=UPI001EF38FD1|nr:hypothetical protein [Actinoplanes brasiliensis]